MDEKQRKTLKFKGKDLLIQVSQYRNNGNLAILSYMEEEPYSNITINLPGMLLDYDEGFIDSIAKTCGLEKKLIKEGIIKEVYGSFQYNLGRYDRVTFNMEKLKEYDPKGIKEYEQDLDEEEEIL